MSTGTGKPPAPLAISKFQELSVDVKWLRYSQRPSGCKHPIAMDTLAVQQTLLLAGCVEDTSK